MNTRSPRIAFIGSLVALFFSALPESYAQDAGIGTFNDLVGQAIEAPPPPTISYPEMKTLSFDGKETVTTTKTGSVFRLQPGVEYDYRFNQQKIGDRFETDINEAHTSLLLSLTRTKFLIEYAHTWSDASNDVMLKRNSESDGIKLSVTQTLIQDPQANTLLMAKEIRLSVPFSFKTENLDALTSGGRRFSDTDSYALNPFLLFLLSWPQDKERYRNLTLSLAPGYRWGVTDKNFTNVNLPEVRGRKGTFSLLPRIDYGICNLVSAYGSATWNHLTNFHSSDSSPPPDRDNFSLAVGISVKPRTKEKLAGMKEADSRPLSLELSYQYDGFNRDFYQHSVTLNATYKF